jgi:hypothetical protein
MPQSDESLIRETQAVAWWESISEEEKRSILRQADRGHYGAQLLNHFNLSARMLSGNNLLRWGLAPLSAPV